MNNLAETAQNTMDLYYQDFKAEEDFFQLYHFKYLNTVAYSALLQRYYDENYRKNLSEFGRGEVELDESWFLQEKLKPEVGNGKWAAELKSKPFSFLHDNQYRSIQDLVPADRQSNLRLARINGLAVWQMASVPNSAYTFWYLNGKKILFEKVKGGIGELIISYLPALDTMDDDALIPQGLLEPTIRATLELMFAARQGTIVNMTNNQNPNKVMEGEIQSVFSRINSGR